MIYTVTLNPALDYFMNFEGVTLGKVNRTGKTAQFAGGKGIMESRMLKKLGVPSVAWGFAGGFSGREILRQLTADGIDSDFVPIAGESRINVKLKTAADETSLDAAGPHLTADEIDLFLEKFEGLTPVDSVVLAGAIPPSLPENFYERLIAKIHAKGAQFAIDIDGQKLLSTLADRPLVVKPNREELEEIFGQKLSALTDIIPYGKKLLSAGAQHVMVSLAGDGALLFAGAKVYFAAPIKGTVKNSIGAGDSTVAGFIAEFSRSHDPIKAFRQGVACGTAKVFSENMPTREFLDTCYDAIKVIEIRR
ncbi:MAG: 1-phosphofructokinase [Streptococcaceae bacterium]|jgi:1-phosphofructokinase|nr:1-phosphofructokinase [Streptococcaceae bacterium]